MCVCVYVHRSTKLAIVLKVYFLSRMNQIEEVPAHVIVKYFGS